MVSPSRIKTNYSLFILGQLISLNYVTPGGGGEIRRGIKIAKIELGN